MGRREPAFASVASCGTSPARNAPSPLATTQEGLFHIAYLAPAGRTLDARPRSKPHGTAGREGAALVRERELADASSFAAIGLLASLQARDTLGPPASWGSLLDGTDEVSEVGRLYDGTIDDALGLGGLSASGHDQGGAAESTR